MLNDSTITRYQAEGIIGINPFAYEHVQPASYDVHLGREAMAYMHPGALTVAPYVDPSKSYDLMERATIPFYEVTTRVADMFFIRPYVFILAHTNEYFKFSPRIVGRLEGRSSLGRLGLLIHATAGLLDPGWEGRITLELFNASPFPIRLWAGMGIGQVTFDDLGTDAQRPYGHSSRHSKYQGDTSVSSSKFYEEVN